MKHAAHKLYQEMVYFDNFAFSIELTQSLRVESHFTYFDNQFQFLICNSLI